jgi:hypothetical protein
MAIFFVEERVTPSENDANARVTDDTAVACLEADTDADDSGERCHEPIVEADDREEAGYGHGV